ncbi:MAG: MAPEG family protein [Dokdonella sp.]
MSLVNLLVILALLQYVYFASRVGWARGKYDVPAPATTGNPIFERHYRVQSNTLELLILLVPAVWIASAYWNPLFIAAMLAIYIVGRHIYYVTYIQDPKKRSMGFGLSFLPIVALLLSGLGGAVWALIRTGI